MLEGLVVVVAVVPGHLLRHLSRHLLGDLLALLPRVSVTLLLRNLLGKLDGVLAALLVRNLHRREAHAQLWWLQRLYE